MIRTLLLLIAASSATAQVPLRGLAYDSLHGRPLFGAFIGIAGMNVTAVSDSAGRFVLPSVPRGTHHVVMQHDVLDAIGLSAAGARAVVNNEGDSVIVAVPSFATLWRAACGRETPASADSGFVFGTVTRGGTPMSGATVAASWLDLSIDSTKAVRQKQKIMEVDTDSSGNFSLCGIPTTTGLSLRANSGGSYGVWTDIPPLDKERIGRRDLTIIAVSPLQFEVPKTTVFTGRVRRDSTDAPISEAEVLLADIGLTALTNERGEFRILDVPVGKHTIQVRKIGFTFRETSFDFAPGDQTNLTLLISSITTLDSVSVTARSSPIDEPMRIFEEHRKTGLGKFLTRADLQRQPNMKVSSLVGQWSGIQITYGGPGVAWLLGNSRGGKSLSGPGCGPMREDYPEHEKRPPPPCPEYCYPRVFVDGVDIAKTQVPNINRFISDDLEGVEYYNGGARLPSEYNVLNARCGVLVLHTRRRGQSP
jgi:hypothetical protein